MSDARTIQLNLRVSSGEADEMRRAAEAAGLSLSEWARLVLRHAAGRSELGKQLDRARKAVQGSR